MTEPADDPDEMPERATRAFETHEAFERAAERAAGGFALTTTDFESRVTAAETDEWALRYTVTVRVPMLSSAVEGTVGPAVEDGWFETFELRLEDALEATRHDVTLESYAVAREDGDAVATFVFEWGNADRAPDVAKAVVEYVEGTYVQGVVPGYDYRDPVAGLLARARQSGDENDTGGPMPL